MLAPNLEIKCITNPEAHSELAALKGEVKAFNACLAKANKTKKIIKFLPIYQQAVKEIEDYFEYRYKVNTPEDIKSFVMEKIDQITKDISNIKE